jgi:hypothetical protein
MAVDAYAIGAREDDARVCVTPEVPHHMLRCQYVPQSRADKVASHYANGVRDERMHGVCYKAKGADHCTVRGWVDQGLSVRSAVERSTGDVRQNGRVTVRHAVMREQSFNQCGIGQLEATIRHPLDPQADMLERRWVTGRNVSSVGGWPLFELNRSPRRQLLLCYLPGTLKRPRKAVNVILCGRRYEKVITVGLHSRILTGSHFLYGHAGLRQNLVPAPGFEPVVSEVFPKRIRARHPWHGPPLDTCFAGRGQCPVKVGRLLHCHSVPWVYQGPHVGTRYVPSLYGIALRGGHS